MFFRTQVLMQYVSDGVISQEVVTYYYVPAPAALPLLTIGVLGSR